MAQHTTIHHFIGGKPYPSKSTEWRDVTNPATQEVVARVPFATREEVELAVATARQAFQTWRSTSLGARMRVMLKLQQLIREHTTELAELITREHGKTLPDAEGEVGRGPRRFDLTRDAVFPVIEGAQPLSPNPGGFADDPAPWRPPVLARPVLRPVREDETPEERRARFHIVTETRDD